MFKCWNCLWQNSNQCDLGCDNESCSYSPIYDDIDDEEEDRLIEENRYEFRREFNNVTGEDTTGYLSLKNFDPVKLNFKS